MLSKLESESCNDSMIGFSILALSLTNTQFFALFSERRFVRNDDSGEDDDDDVIIMLSSSGEGIMVTIQCVFGMLGLGNGRYGDVMRRRMRNENFMHFPELCRAFSEPCVKL